MGLGGRVIRYHGALSNKIVCEEATGSNLRICSWETNILFLQMQSVWRGPLGS